MKLPTFKTDPQCTLCNKYEEPPATNRCVPTIWMPGSLPPRKDANALVFVGINPGYHEDRLNEPFVGRSGILLRGGWVNWKGDPTFTPGTGDYLQGAYVHGLNFQEICSIYLTNIVRCGVEAKSNDTCFRTCRDNYLLPDLEAIVAAHSEAERIGVVSLSAPSSRHLVESFFQEKGLSQKKCFSQQGRTVALSGVYVALWHTYHPAHVDRDNNLIRSVSDHLQLVRRWLDGETPEASKPSFTKPRFPK